MSEKKHEFNDNQLDALPETLDFDGPGSRDYAVEDKQSDAHNGGSTYPGFITNFQSPIELDELVERLDEYDGITNINLILDHQDTFGEWTVAKDCNVGDIVFFMCAKTSAAHMAHVCAEAKRQKCSREIIDYAEDQRRLYRSYAGTILAVGKVQKPPYAADSGFKHTHWKNPWYADIDEFRLLKEPISIDRFRSFITVSRTGAITKLTNEQISKLLVLIGDECSESDDSAAAVVAEESYTEGKKLVETIHIETKRNPKSRKKCLDIKGTTCAVCGFNSEDKYGVPGIIHVHHLKPLSEVQVDESVGTVPLNDLEPVCPNCHAVIHSKKDGDGCYSIEEVRQMLGLPPKGENL